VSGGEEFDFQVSGRGQHQDSRESVLFSEKQTELGFR